MNKRQFLRSLIVGTSALAVAPQYLFAQSEKYHSPIVNLEVRVDKLDGDFLSENYHSHGKKSIIHKSLEKTKEFYSNMGQEYELPGVDIKIMNPTGNENPINNTFKFYYATLDKFMERIENDPNLVENIFGKKKSDELKTMGDVFLEIAREKTIKKYQQEAQGAGGGCIPGTQEIFLISKDWYNQMNAQDPKIRSNAISLLQYINSHELAHIFGLDHVEKIPKNKYNLMTPGPSAETILNPKLNQEQVQKVLAYFK